MVSCTVSSDSRSLDVLDINNLVFMDDSTLISSSKEGMEHMLSITEEFYCLNNTSANHNKYVLATNAVAASQDLSSIAFTLLISSLNTTPNITVTPIPMSSSFHFLGVWFNINGSRNFIRQQLKQECNSFSATLRPVKLTVQQVVYLYNTVLIPKLNYQMQVTHLSEAKCSTVTSSVRTLVKHKAKLLRSIPNVFAKELVLCTPPSGYKKNWIVMLNNDGLPLFGKQIQIQPKHFTCTIAHWTSDCSSRPSELAEIMDYVTLYCNLSTYSGLPVDTSCPSLDTVDDIPPPLLTANDIATSSSVVLSSDSLYTFYTDGSFINLGTSDVFIS
ncbi:hypothetical protein GLOIN_2v1783661 [Rhizophagus irregularis DAOM 181602=DAOM 197198]|nr:hypothetical protein GLOIN_2v1783661 [Rhizophagus irregularis DAOM 181602=DAOM 197198]